MKLNSMQIKALASKIEEELDNINKKKKDNILKDPKVISAQKEIDELYKQYSKYSKAIDKCFNKIKHLGVDIQHNHKLYVSSYNYNKKHYYDTNSIKNKIILKSIDASDLDELVNQIIKEIK